MGRRDSTTANRTLADENLPGPTLTLEDLKAKFINVGLNGDTDLVSLSGAHTFGRSQCQFFSQRLYNFNGTNQPDPSLDTTYLQVLQALCPEGGNGSVLANLDTSTPDVFDNNYFTNLQGNKGLLQTDQELFSTAGADTIQLTNTFSLKRRSKSLAWALAFSALSTSLQKQMVTNHLKKMKQKQRKVSLIASCNFILTI